MKRRSLVGAVIIVVLCAWAIALALLFAKQTTPSAPPPTTTTRAVVATTTTTDPFANLRASLNDYCGAKHKGHAVIVVKSGAPDGGCSG